MISPTAESAETMASSAIVRAWFCVMAHDKPPDVDPGPLGASHRGALRALRAPPAYEREHEA
jgi:hypothetical protein